MDDLMMLAALPVIVIGMYIYAKDRNKEPKDLLFKLLLAGVGSAFLTLFISGIIIAFIPGFSNFEESKNILIILLGAFLGVGLVEEFSKWIFAYKISYNNPEFDEFYDMIIYCVFVSLGFALFENIAYVLQGGYTVAIARALLAVPGHACDGVFMGYFLSLAKYFEVNNQPSKKKKCIALSIIVPTIMHGTYDFLIMANNSMLLLVFFVLVIAMYVVSIKRVKKAAADNVNFYYKAQYCGKCGQKAQGKFCSNCGNKIE